MPDQLQLRGGTTTEHNSFTGALREVTVDTTKKTLVVHDGASAGGTALMKESGGNAASTVGIGVGGANKLTINSDGHVDIASNLDCAAGIDVTGAITGTGDLTIDTNTLHVDSSDNRVGIGTASPAQRLVVNAGSDNSDVAVFTGGDNSRGLKITTSATSNTNDSVVTFNAQTASHGTLAFAVANGSEAMRIDSSGNVGIGTSNPQTKLHLDMGAGGLPAIRLQHSSSGNDIFEITGGLSGVSNSGFGIRDVDENAYRFVIDSSGNVGIGTTSMANKLEVVGTIQANVSANTASYTQAFNITNAVNADFNVHLKTNSTSIGSSTNTPLCFHTGGSANTKMLIDSSGRVGIGTSIQDHLLHVKGSSAVLKIDHTGSGDTTGVVMRHARGGLSGFNGKMISFIGNDSTEEGSIVIHTTTTAYNTSSDYRLKENEVAISDPIIRLKQLKPYTFNFKKDPNVKVDGFFAHEVSSVVPIAVTGEKDAVNDDGSIKPQGIDQSKLVPLLVAAVQELTAKVEALEAA